MSKNESEAVDNNGLIGRGQSSSFAAELIASFLGTRKEKQINDLGRSAVEKVMPSLEGYEDDVRPLRQNLNLLRK